MDWTENLIITGRTAYGQTIPNAGFPFDPTARRRETWVHPLLPRLSWPRTPLDRRTFLRAVSLAVPMLDA